MAQLNFDASNVAPAVPPEAIPAGWYNAMMTASEMKPTSNGRGAYLECEYTILDGEYKGRKQFDRINLQNANPVAVEIGYKTLSAICHATGVVQVQDSAQLHNHPLAIKVSVRSAGVGDDGIHRDATNDVKGYKAASTNAAAQAAPAQQFAPPPVQQAPVQGQPAWAAAPQYQQQAPVQQPQYQQPNIAQQAPVQQQAPAQMPPWAGQPAPQPQPTQIAAPQYQQQAPVQQPQYQQPNIAQQAPVQQQAPVGGGTPPWAQQPAA